MIAQTHTTISAKSAIAAGARIQKSRATKVAKRNVAVRADWSLGSTENVIVCANTFAIMGAMRFGLMPSVKKNYNGASSYGMVEQASTKNIGSRDPAGFTAVDVLAAGSFATIISAGEILAGQVPY